MNEIIKLIIFIILSYLLGSVMFSILIPKWLYKIDVTVNSNDHNPGSSSVFKNCGVQMGLLCLCLDLLKGYIPVLVGMLLFDNTNPLFGFIIIAPVVGHVFPILNGFKGGKGIATSFGVLLGLLPNYFMVFVLAFYYLLFSLIIKIYPIRKRSIITFLLFGISSFVISLFLDQIVIALACLFIGILCALKHTKYLSFVSEDEQTEKSASL